MAKPKRKPVCTCGMPFCMSCEAPRPRYPSDTERLDALLRWIARRFSSGLWVWIGKRWQIISTRRDIDKLLKEEARRG